MIKKAKRLTEPKLKPMDALMIPVVAPAPALPSFRRGMLLAKNTPENERDEMFLILSRANPIKQAELYLSAVHMQQINHQQPSSGRQTKSIL